jgi:methionyl-tRNA formyltransferase
MFHRSQVVSDIIEVGEPGSIVEIEPEGFIVATRPGAVRILELQAEGRQPLRSAEFIRGSRLATGLRFEPLPVT